MTVSTEVRQSVDARIRVEQVRLLYAHGRGAFVVNVIASALLVTLVAHAVRRTDVYIWCGVFTFAWLLRGALHYARWKYAARLSDAVWLRLFGIATVVSGSVWGATALWLSPRDLLDQFVCGVTVMGMVAGAAASISCVRGLYELYLMTAFLPVAVRFAFENGSETSLIIALSVLYCIGMTLAAQTNYRLLQSSLRLRFENEALADQLETLATHDPLTGLPNRRMLVDQLGTALRRARRFDTGVSVVFVDCDNFKHINDTYGHAVGDEYLQGIARALQEAVREIDTVARLGGDEFIVMLDGAGNRAQVETIVRRIHSRATRPLDLLEFRMVPHLSIGVAMYPRDAQDAESLIRLSDHAMYEAKRSGGNDVRFTQLPPSALEEQVTLA